MRVEFVQERSGPDRKVADAEMVFEQNDGPLFGTRLVGFTLWRDGNGELYVTPPGKPIGHGAPRAGSPARYFDFMRDASKDFPGGMRRLKEWILEQWVQWNADPSRPVR